MSEFAYPKKLKRRILIVEDEEINREILANILEDHYEVSCAENGAQALQLFREHTAPYSLILLDLLMSVMGGEEFLTEIKADERLSGIPVIVMTSEKPAEVSSIKMGADDFITKPYDSPEVILARCERIIQLYEDNSIIRSAEKDELTELFTREFFQEYVRQIDSYDDAFAGLSEELAGYSHIPKIRIRADIYQNADKHVSIEDRFDHAKLACDRIRGDYTKQISYYSKELNDADLYHERLINDIDDAIANRDLIVFY
ncbi:MAG: response regulator, partial [Lachnospiraceae bacterium]|nr:response regulator [Lachnospiraceae bacterium]